MNILFAIPHYFAPQEGVHASQRGAARQERLRALTACLSALHTTFGRAQGIIDIAQRRARAANQHTAHRIQVCLLTDGSHHLLDDLPLPKALYTHAPQEVPAPHLGFACQRFLAEHLGKFDCYAYLEDDLILQDALFFDKLAWFRAQTGEACLLQPNRFESNPRAPLHKVYVDGDLRPEVTAPFQDVSQKAEIRALLLGRELRFVRPLNPHSGCYFLSAAQMRRWADSPDFGQPSTAFIGPLESAATLGVMRHFRVYKPAPENAAFLEVQHYGTGFLRLVGGKVHLESIRR